MNTNDMNEKGHDQAATSMKDKELDAVVGGAGLGRAALPSLKPNPAITILHALARLCRR